MRKLLSLMLAFIFFVQIPCFTFASENVSLKENENQRIAMQYENGKVYVAVFDKNTKILVQNTYDEKTNKLLNTIRCNLNINPKVLKSSDTYTTSCGYNYYRFDNGDVNCSKPGNKSKVILSGISSDYQFHRALDYKDTLIDLRATERGIAGATLLILIGLILPGGEVVMEVTAAMLEAAGVSQTLLGAARNLRHDCEKCANAYDKI